MKKRIQYIFVFLMLTACSAVHGQTLKEAIRLTESEQYEMAALAYQQLLSSQPANGTLYFYYGENYLLSDEKDSAMMTFKKGLQAEPANMLNEVGLAKLEFDLGHAVEGNKLLDEALSKAGPKNALVMMEAADALIHFKSKNLDKAKELLDKAYALDPKNPDIQILYGDMYAEKNDGTHAAEHYNMAVDLDKSSVRAIVSKGVLYRRSTNYDGATEEFKNAIKIDPNYAGEHRELGDAYIKLGKLEEAKEEYRKYLTLSKNNCNARIKYASFLYYSKDYAGALNEISQLKQKCDSNNVTLLRVASYCYYETKDYVKGINTVDRLFSLLPEEKRIINDYEYYGKLNIAANRDSVGIDALRKSYDMDKTRVDLLFELGNSLMKVKRYDEAAATFKEKIATGREVKSFDYFKLGQCYFFAQQFLNADTAFNKLCEMQPKYATGFLWNAKNKTRIDSTSEAGLALPMYDKYVELAMADSANAAKYTEGLKEAYGYMASYYFLQKKDKTKAVLYLRKKLDLMTEPADKKDIQTMIDQIEGKK
jgi:tetratricopeptide (TPR) repeat protein